MLCNLLSPQLLNIKTSQMVQKVKEKISSAYLCCVILSIIAVVKNISNHNSYIEILEWYTTSQTKSNHARGKYAIEIIQQIILADSLDSREDWFIFFLFTPSSFFFWVNGDYVLIWYIIKCDCIILLQLWSWLYPVVPCFVMNCVLLHYSLLWWFMRLLLWAAWSNVEK